MLLIRPVHCIDLPVSVSNVDRSREASVRSPSAKATVDATIFIGEHGAPQITISTDAGSLVKRASDYNKYLSIFFKEICVTY